MLDGHADREQGPSRPLDRGHAWYGMARRKAGHGWLLLTYPQVAHSTGARHGTIVPLGWTTRRSTYLLLVAPGATSEVGFYLTSRESLDLDLDFPCSTRYAH